MNASVQQSIALYILIHSGNVKKDTIPHMNTNESIPSLGFSYKAFRTEEGIIIRCAVFYQGSIQSQHFIKHEDVRYRAKMRCKKGEKPFFLFDTKDVAR